MYTYVQVNEKGRVHTIMDSYNRLVEVPVHDDRIVGTIYDPETGQFIGYRIALEAEQSATTGEPVIVTANVLTWDEQPSDYAGDVILDINGERHTVTAENGVATYEYTPTEAGTVTIKTVNDVLSNGEIVIEVTAAPEPEPPTEEPTE